ncbi:MAG TPA: DMT family transporter [Thermoanaerobaculia bacterium]|jgi:drug/metabolite transporter (DMT)-like permease|nr:DMT family transporter [Thermoanaerobaculia bacterium]
MDNLRAVTIPNPSHDATATRRALLLMIASALLFGAMAFTAKLASARLSGSQVAFIRFAIGLMPALLIPRFRASAFTFQRLDLLFYRGFFGGVAVLFYFIAIERIAVGVATLLNYTSPVFSGIFSMFFLRERISPKVLIPMPIALAGVFLVVHAHARPGDILGFGKWELVGLASALASGLAVTAMRAARRGENSWSVYTSFCLLGTVVTAPLAILTWKQPTADEWFSLIATSLFAIGAQLLLTFSLRWVDAMTVGVISQLAVLVSMALGAAFLGEHITAMAALGAALTIGGVVGVVYVTSLAKRTVIAADEVAPES